MFWTLTGCGKIASANRKQIHRLFILSLEQLSTGYTKCGIQSLHAYLDIELNGPAGIDPMSRVIDSLLTDLDHATIYNAEITLRGEWSYSPWQNANETDVFRSENALRRSTHGSHL
jgi:hypothetical protein